MANLNPVPACTNSNYGDVVDFFVGSVATNVNKINLTSVEVANQSDDAVAFRNGTGAFVTTAAIADYRSGETDFTTGSAGFSTAATSAEAGLLPQGNFSSLSFTGTITRKTDSGTEYYATMQLGNTNVKSQFAAKRSDERRVGKACVGTCRCRRAPRT